MSEWKEYSLSDIINLIGGGTPKTSVPEYWNGEIPWLSVADFNRVHSPNLGIFRCCSEAFQTRPVFGE